MQNAEGTVISYINSRPGKPASAATRIPNPRPPQFIRVQRTGGDERNMIQERAVLLVECWGGTDTEAWAVTKFAHELLQGRTPLEHNGVELEERSCSSPVNYPDPSTTSPRYTFTLTTTVNLKGPPS